MNEIINIIFNLFMLPFEKLALHKRRSEMIPKVSGNVLEVGSGGGMNFNYYQADNIEKLTMLDLKFNRAIEKHKLNNKLDIDYLVANAEQIPFEDNTFDSVVGTLIFCSIDNQEKALSEIYRVLKPGGKLYFLEHVVPEEEHYKKIADNINSTWKKIGKCNINRETHKRIEEANFKIEDFEMFGKECFMFVKGIGVK